MSRGMDDSSVDIKFGGWKVDLRGDWNIKLWLHDDMPIKCETFLYLNIPS